MPPLNLKQEFESLKAFKQALYIWAIEEHFEPRILKSDSHHVRVGCKVDAKCDFSIRCNAYNAGPRVPVPLAKITVLRAEHTCAPDEAAGPLNRQVANRIPWLLDNVPRFLDVTPTTSIESIQEAILAQSGYTVNLQQIRRVRRLLVKGKDFRSPQRDRASQQQQQERHDHHALSHASHGQHHLHHHHNNGINPQHVTGGGIEHSGHSHAHLPSQHTPTSANNGFAPSRPVDGTHHDPHHANNGSNASSLLHGTLNPLSSTPTPTHNDAFTHSAAAARLANQFDEHSQLITALADPVHQVGGTNLFDVSHAAPPPRLLDAPPPMGLGRELDRSLPGRVSMNVHVNGTGSCGGGGGGGGAGPPEQPQRCPFCVNVKWMKSIKEAVEHMSVHVV